MNKAPYTQSKMFDHEDVEIEFTDALCFMDVFIDLGMAALVFAAMMIVVFTLVAARDNWGAWVTWLVLAVGGV